jgi:hypothetical protein
MRAVAVMLSCLLVFSAAACLVGAYPLRTAHAAVETNRATLVVSQTFSGAGSTDTGATFTYRLRAGGDAPRYDTSYHDASYPMPQGSGGQGYDFSLTGNTTQSLTIDFAGASPGIYTYWIDHVTGAQTGYSYDTTRYVIEVYLMGDRTATPYPAVVDGGKLGGEGVMMYNHTYTATPPIPQDPTDPDPPGTPGTTDPPITPEPGGDEGADLPTSGTPTDSSTLPVSYIQSPTVPESQLGFSEPVTGLDEEDMARIEGQTGNPLVDLLADNVPLGNLNVKGAWSLLGLILVVLSVLFALQSVISELIARIRRYRQSNRAVILLITCVLFAVAVVVIWTVLEDMRQPMVWINSWSAIVGMLFVVQLALCFSYGLLRNKARREQDDTESKLSEKLKQTT